MSACKKKSSPAFPSASPALPRKILDFLNQPLVAGILILIGTSLLQQWGWRSQQRYINEQLRANAVREKKQNTVDEVTVGVGKLLTSYASIVGAHEEKVKTPQLDQTIDKYHELQREWDQEEDLLKLRIQTYFSVPQIQTAWSLLLDRLGELDSQIHQLHEFNTMDTSEAHQKQITLCRNTITDIEKQLAAMTGIMTNHLNDYQ
jgi:hypothetical protein